MGGGGGFGMAGGGGFGMGGGFGSGGMGGNLFLSYSKYTIIFTKKQKQILL